LYDLMKPHATEVLVCNTRKNAVRKSSKGDRIDARKLSEQLYVNNVKSIYHGEHGLRMMKELARSYLTITKDLTRVIHLVAGTGNAPTAIQRYRAEWLAKINEAGVNTARSKDSSNVPGNRPRFVLE
jgi:hypothetical protein